MEFSVSNLTGMKTLVNKQTPFYAFKLYTIR